MSSRNSHVAAVLEAADQWVSAQEALVAARQIPEETEAEQQAADAAGSRLVVAVTRWRSSPRELG
jgi:RecB family exonuclease